MNPSRIPKHEKKQNNQYKNINHSLGNRDIKNNQCKNNDNEDDK